jgi:hypothetical protein
MAAILDVRSNEKKQQKNLILDQQKDLVEMP